MGDRKTIRPTEDVYDLLNEERKQLNLTWDEYFRKLHDGSGIEVTLSSGSVEDIANAVENRVLDSMKNGRQ